MRISGNGAETTQLTNSNTQIKIKTVLSNAGEQGSESIAGNSVEQQQPIEYSRETKAKVQEAVNKMNEMLEVNNSFSKFMYHEGLERFYVTVVDRETEEVVKEIPPKKLLDVFYEMQKMLGMIVDEKI